MTDKPLPKDEPGAEERFERGIKNALAMKPKPHAPKKPKEPTDEGDSPGDRTNSSGRDGAN